MTLTPLVQHNFLGRFDFSESNVATADIGSAVGNLKPDLIFLENLELRVRFASAYLATLHRQVLSLEALSRPQQAVITRVGSYNAAMPRNIAEKPILRPSAIQPGKHLFKIHLRLEFGTELILELGDLAVESPRLHIKGEVDDASCRQNLCFLAEQLSTLFPSLTVFYSDAGTVPEQGANGKFCD